MSTYFGGVTPDLFLQPEYASTTIAPLATRKLMQ